MIFVFRRTTTIQNDWKFEIMSDIIIDFNDRALCISKDQEYIETVLAFQITLETFLTERSAIENARTFEEDIYSTGALQWSDPFVYWDQTNKCVRSQAILIKG
mmetsp:Transcript_5015/g.7610  ORF Transcript_5015/g.7610 Transcript_5015/m.7610 type:complete len:103 (-) Transcript_5015:215-523(-)